MRCLDPGGVLRAFGAMEMARVKYHSADIQVPGRLMPARWYR